MLPIKAEFIKRHWRPAVTLGDQGDQNIDIMGRDIVVEISYISAITS